MFVFTDEFFLKTFACGARMVSVCGDSGVSGEFLYPFSVMTAAGVTGECVRLVQ